MSGEIPEGYSVRAKPRSALRMLAASLLTFELFVVFFIGLTIFGLKIVSMGTAITLTSVTVALGLVAIGTLRWPVGYWLGWLFHALMFAGAILHLGVLVVAAIFLALWITSLYWGRRIDRERAAWAKENLPDA